MILVIFLVKEKSRSKSTALSTVNGNSLRIFIVPSKYRTNRSKQLII